MLEPNMAPELPISDFSLNEYSREFYLKTLKELQAKRVWIALYSREIIFTKNRTPLLEKLKEHVRYFQDNGVETGIWTSTLGFGGPLGGCADIPQEDFSDWMRITPIRGGEYHHDAFCPSDSRFVAFMEQYMEDLASLKPDLIMLDDELCLSIRPGIGCFCETHRKLLKEKTGTELSFSQWPQAIFTGGPNSLRDAWYDLMGDTLRSFCAAMRKAVDRVEPSIRMGQCAGYSSWDMEGVSAIELSRILAGGTKPFFRFTSAPYWVSALYHRFPGQGLNSIIECARLQQHWCKEAPEVEFFAENDTYPRPAYHSGSALCESFEFAMQALGISSLKYMLDYISSPDYEEGYLRRHRHNQGFYQAIRAAFADKHFTGVRLFRPAQRIRTAVLPEQFPGEKNVLRLFFSQATALLTGLGIPVCYDESSVGCAAFGEDARNIPDVSACKKLILDLPAALLLKEQRVDVGLKEASPLDEIPFQERFGKERVLLSGVGQSAVFPQENKIFLLSLKEGARPESFFVTNGGERVGSYTYSDGCTEFLVFNFNSLAVGENSSLYLSYCRQEQILRFLEEPFPIVKKHPGIYSLCACSENGDAQAVLLQNLGSDPAFDFDIELEKGYRRFSMQGAEGVLSPDGCRIHVSGDFFPSTAILLELQYTD